MSSDNSHQKRPSRRTILKGGLAATLGSAFGSALAFGLPSRATAASGVCPTGLDPASGKLNGVALQASAAGNEHTIFPLLYKTVGYAVGMNTTETRYVLCADVGLNPLAGVFHPVEDGGVGDTNTITDIYVFNKADGKQLFWRKLGSGETSASAMFIIPPGLLNAGITATVVARCAKHGLFSVDFPLNPAAALDYKNAVGTYDATQLCGGSTLLRPYISFDATGGQGNLGVEHRPNGLFDMNGQLIAFLGGDLTGNAAHANLGEGHYVMGIAIYDQDGNQLFYRPNLFSATNSFRLPGFKQLLLAKGVTTVRLVLFDSQNGRFMSFLDM